MVKRGAPVKVGWSKSFQKSLDFGREKVAEGIGEVNCISMVKLIHTYQGFFYVKRWSCGPFPVPMTVCVLSP